MGMKKTFETQTRIETHWRARRPCAVLGEDERVTSIRLRPLDVFDEPMTLDVPLTRAEALQVPLNSKVRVRIEIEVME